MLTAKRVSIVVVAILAWVALAAPRATLAVSFEGGKQIIDNARVTVWDVIWPTDRRVAVPRYTNDTVTVALTDGPVRIVDLVGTEKTVIRGVGDVQFELRGAGHREEAVGAGVPHDIVIELKDNTVAALVNKSGYPNAFPRPGSKKLLENDRIIAWDYTWTAGVPTPMHFHDKDVVVTYLETGMLASTSPDGQVADNPHYFAFTKYNARDRAHTETLVKGKGRAIIVELK
jgi:hypothetical protein